MPSQVIVFFQPRSACRVMMRMVFEKQENINSQLHQFSAARGAQVGWLRSDDYENGMTEADRQNFDSAVEKNIESWEKDLKQAKDQNRLLLFQTYPFSPVKPERVLEYMHKITSYNASTELQSENFTMIPDSLLLAPGTIPILVIRNPRLTVPSAFRILKNMGLNEGGGRPMALMTTSLIWFRVLYDYYTSHGIRPLVLDADDYLTSEDYVRKICSQLGLDQSKVQFSWPVLSAEEKGKMHPMEFLSAEEIHKSTGPDSSRAGSNMDEDMGQGNWVEEFGEADTKLIEELVGYGIPHYEYLSQKKLQL